MASKHHRTLRIKIIVSTLCYSLIPLFALGITIYYQFSMTYESKVKDTLKILAQNRRNSIELFFAERVSQLVTVARTNSMDKLKDEANLNNVFNTMQARSKSYIDLGVIDAQGDHLAYVGPYHEELKSVNYKHEDWFQAVMSSGIYVSDVFLGFRKIPHFIIAVATIEGSKTWILRATINSEIIDQIVREVQVGKRGDSFIVNKNNILQTQPRFGGRILQAPTTPDFSAAVGTTVEDLPSNGEHFFYATSQIDNPKWVLVIKEDPQEEMAPLFQTRYIQALVLITGVGLVVAGTLFTSRSMMHELIRIEREIAKSDNLVMQSSKMAALGKMAAGIAHEINNPLAIIGEKAGWMKDLLEKEDVANSENFKEFEDCIKKIERQVERSRVITHRMLRFGRRMEPTQDMVDINQILSETITFLENEAHYRNIEIKTEYDSNLPRVTTDSAQLQQVFLNIINNGIDAVSKDGWIRIKTVYDQSDDRFLDSTKNRVICIAISDNGPGIPKNVMARIFDPFFTTKGMQDGTGLGLSISYSIIEKLGGHITVDSEVGVGTTFKIFVPTK